nr:MAG TPA: hypothetical protein [Caudoviricetes sp.]
MVEYSGDATEIMILFFKYKMYVYYFCHIAV